ncbi:RagB/SusD family nutrient uptake outer membrane protein [Spirosoma sordidisoli]|uniref:RagB/SusD family nutrient uptake outer membrane protein n=1 Tax=Spirosoma sordidisoli TaxID=2502893 RepID=A0A4Q2UTX9_9BACT|nr:RagB/SusD family nutrient uptake outer membrane protein [Spirosoma sordidisoli]RYC71285.1 RagB/SusD family nutrient uptake outer membrane protein [Spirosoma sordidisoli]
MNKLKLILPLLVLLSGCSQFLEVQPELQVDEQRAITNAATAEVALNGLYNRLGNDGYYGSNFSALSYLSGGDIQWTGSQGAPQEITARKLTADNGYVGSAWGAIYRTILAANYLLETVPALTDPQLTEARKNQIRGEALAIRALSYFDLARGWGGVQLILKPTRTPSDNTGIQRSSAADTYAQVLKDLTAAEPLLAATTNRNRVTRKTVWALRARYHLYRQEWAEAESYATRLIDDATNYRLVKPYSAFFANNAVNTTESVFELAYSNSFKNGHFNWWLPPALSGRREWAPNAQLVSLLNNPAIGGNRSAVIAQTAPPGNLWYGRLYYRTPTGTDPAYLIRIAELYLIRAEARARLNKPADALADLNAVRSRADLAALTTATTPTTEAILLAIENERRLEFAFETDRWFDLIRTGRVAPVLGITDPNKYVLPIPTSEILADKSLTQNQGY